MKKKRVKKEEEGEKEEEEEGDGGMVTRGKMFTVSLWVCAFFFFFCPHGSLVVHVGNADFSLLQT